MLAQNVVLRGSLQLEGWGVCCAGRDSGTGRAEGVTRNGPPRFHVPGIVP
jgi:hypothetical protein